MKKTPAQQLGALGGAKKTEAKAAAARANGAKGGRPPLLTLVKKTCKEDWTQLVVAFEGDHYEVLVATGEGEPEIYFDGLSEDNAVLRDAVAAKTGLGATSLVKRLLALMEKED